MSWLDDRLVALQAWGDRRERTRWASTPLVERPLARPDEYRRRWETARRVSYPEIDRWEQTWEVAIDRAWLDDLALLTQVTIKSSDLCYQHGRLLYALVRRAIRRVPEGRITIVETGTARGFSALCLAKGLRDAGRDGLVLTFDLLPHDARIYWNCWRDSEGPRSRAELLEAYGDLLENVVVFHRGDSARQLARVSVPRIHVAVLDSVHTYEHVRAEWAAIRGRQQTGDVLFFDDYTADQYPGVVRAADEICAEGGYTPTVITATPRRRYLVAEKR